MLRPSSFLRIAATLLVSGSTLIGQIQTSPPLVKHRLPSLRRPKSNSPQSPTAQSPKRIARKNAVSRHSESI
jgi:hypothetical protein